MQQIIKNYFDFLGRPGEILQIDFADGVFFARDLSIKDKIRLLNLSIIEERTELIPGVVALEKFLPERSLCCGRKDHIHRWGISS